MPVAMSGVAPATYRPWLKGVYDVSPGLRPLGTDFGNGVADAGALQIDREWPRYRANKLSCWRTRRGRHFGEADLPAEVRKATLMRLRAELGACEGLPVPEDAEGLDALALGIAEDVAVVVRRGGRDWLAYAAVCAPSHWAPEARLGLPFFQIHAPIPGFARANAGAAGLVEAMISRGPWVRFVWGIESDSRLNHHPVPPPGVAQDAWDGRDFGAGRFWVRFERQVILPLPEVEAAIFLIRVGHIEDAVVRQDAESWVALGSAVRGMSPEALSYKGIARDHARLLRLLSRPPSGVRA